MRHHKPALLIATVLSGLLFAAPGALAIGADPAAGLANISCTSPGNCTAVTTYQNAIGQGEGEMITESGGVWQPAVQAILPKNAAANPMSLSTYGPYGLSQTDCAAAGECSAIGDYRDKSGKRHGLFLTESGGEWHAGAEAKFPANASTKKFEDFAELDSVNCTSAGSCIAAGDYEVSGKGSQVAVFQQTAGKWGAGKELKLPGSASATHQSAQLSAITCTSAGNCVAVGTFTNAKRSGTPLIATETAGRWHTAAVTLPGAHGSSAQLLSVSCSIAGDCSAGGRYETTKFDVLPLLVTETAGVWGAGTTVALPADRAQDAFNQQSLVGSVDCSAPGDCTAVGSYTDSSRNTQGLLLNEAGEIWAASAKAPLPAAHTTKIGTQSAYLGQVSCISSGNCLAIGTFNQDDASNTPGILVEEQTGGTWSTSNTIPSPADSARDQQGFGGAVACFPGTGTGPSVGGADCEVVGGYEDVSGNLNGFGASAAGGVFTQAVKTSIPSVSRAEVHSSLMPVVDPRGTHAEANLISADDGYRFTVHAAESGHLYAFWRAVVGGREQLVAQLSTFVPAAGPAQLKLSLTPLGRHLFKEAKPPRILAHATFSGPAVGSVTRTQTFFPLSTKK